MSLKLQQKLSFQMIQSLKLLQINTLQLEQLINTELEMNPVLETAEETEADEEREENEEANEEEGSDEGDGEDDTDEELEVNEDEVDWEEYLEDGFDIGGKMTEETESKSDTYEPTAVYQASLTEYLTNQLAEKKLSKKMRMLVQFIIGNLDADGYCRIPLEDIASSTNTSVFDVEEALNIVWNMDPPGVGARNLRECLMLQLKARGLHDSMAMKVISEAWELFEKLKILDIAKKFGVDSHEVQGTIDVLRTLNPKPGYQISSDKPSVIIPDLIVEKVDGEFVAYLNDRSIPMLRINRRYADLIKRGSSAKKEVKKYVREKLNNATWLIRSIEQRKSTMLKVMYAIIDKQRDFFEKGPPNLHPLKLQDVADMVEMHISTISRVTNNKYVQTSYGIFELKYFFTEAVGSGGGGDISSERIRNRIRQLVEEENQQKPLSDQKIADLLSKEGLSVARRTVAKYREQMKILPARMRQKYD
jgi:RNA polymerase sigma-54 factor